MVWQKTILAVIMLTLGIIIIIPNIQLSDIIMRELIGFMYIVLGYIFYELQRMVD